MPPRTTRTIYMMRTTKDLRELKSKKINRLDLLSAAYPSFFVKKEMAILEAQIDAISNELFVRSLSIQQKK